MHASTLSTHDINSKLLIDTLITLFIVDNNNGIDTRLRASIRALGIRGFRAFRLDEFVVVVVESTAGCFVVRDSLI